METNSKNKEGFTLVEYLPSSKIKYYENNNFEDAENIWQKRYNVLV